MEKITLHRIIGNFLFNVRNDSQTCFLETSSLLMVLGIVKWVESNLPSVFFIKAGPHVSVLYTGVPKRTSQYDLDVGNNNNH